MNRKFRRIHEACTRKKQGLSANKIANTMANKSNKVGITSVKKLLNDKVLDVNNDLKQSSDFVVSSRFKKPLLHFVAVKNSHEFYYHEKTEFDARTKAFSELGSCSDFYQVNEKGERI